MPVHTYKKWSGVADQIRHYRRRSDHARKMEPGFLLMSCSIQQRCEGYSGKRNMRTVRVPLRVKADYVFGNNLLENRKLKNSGNQSDPCKTNGKLKSFFLTFFTRMLVVQVIIKIKYLFNNTGITLWRHNDLPLRCTKLRCIFISTEFIKNVAAFSLLTQPFFSCTALDEFSKTTDDCGW